MKLKLRIGTRDSALALWQASFVHQQLLKLGVESELIPVKSQGDLELEKPLYEMGVTGIFTKTLDIALLQGDIDIAVHSMKDVPTLLPSGIIEAAVLKRASNKDVLIYKGENPMLVQQATIATGSLRRKAQWLHRFKNHQIVNLRGNIQTRLEKLDNHAWHGAIFAEAGLDRADLKPQKYALLDWMYPAPAQGAMLVVCRDNQPAISTLLTKLNHSDTATCVRAERSFLRSLEGGCTAPIGAEAVLNEDKITLKGALFSLNGKEKLEIVHTMPKAKANELGIYCAEKLLENGGKILMQSIKSEMSKHA